MTVVATFPKLAHDWLVHELDRDLWRRAGIIKQGSGKVTTGTVLGCIKLGVAEAAPKAGGNTGQGTLTMDVTTPVLANAKTGVYVVRCIATSAGGGTFRVEDPDGYVIGDVAVGATFADGIKFAISDGDPDFALGDGFDVEVAIGSRKYVPLDFDAIDGSQVAAAICINTADATAADIETAVLTGHAQIVRNQLVWPEGATSDQRIRALAQLETIGIVSHQR